MSYDKLSQQEESTRKEVRTECGTFYNLWDDVIKPLRIHFAVLALFVALFFTALLNGWVFLAIETIGNGWVNLTSPRPLSEGVSVIVGALLVTFGFLASILLGVYCLKRRYFTDKCRFKTRESKALACFYGTAIFMASFALTMIFVEHLDRVDSLVLSTKQPEGSVITTTESIPHITTTGSIPRNYTNTNDSQPIQNMK